MPITSGAAFNVAQNASPPSRIGVNNATAEITLTRGGSTAGKLLLVWTRLVIGLDIFRRLLLAPALKLVKQIVDGETHGAGFFDEAFDEFVQVFLVFFAMICAEMTGADKRSHASSCLEDSVALQLRVDLGDWFGVEAPLDRHVAEGRQLFRCPQSTILHISLFVEALDNASC